MSKSTKKPLAEGDLYTGRRSYGGLHGLGECVENAAPQFIEDSHLKNYRNCTKSGYLTGAGGDATKNRPGGFDHSPARGREKR
jgi:hypothetical protein